MADAPKPTCGKGSNFFGRPGRSGPRPGQRNNLRHGLRAGVLPRDCRHIQVRLNDFRRGLEDAVLDAKGSVSIHDAACVQTAVRWERHAALAQKWLFEQYADLKIEQRIDFSREIARASAARDKSIQMLGLQRDQLQDAWNILDVTPAGPSNGDLEGK